ncbi:hypothetical protein ZTR_06242 [Talaromyces verruculosus]|nr:hypothetical protein ZTR_06242 [Talaromyces verruculosus]
MLEPILSPCELWPGGIPSSIRLHADASLSEGDDRDWTEDDKPYSADEEDEDFSEDTFVREESKGWCQFVHEEWVPMTDLNEEMQQRRALIEDGPLPTRLSETLHDSCGKGHIPPHTNRYQPAHDRCFGCFNKNIWKSPSQYPPDYWAREVDYFAPSYLELEAEDREADYDPNNLTNYDKLINFYPPPEQREDQFKELIKAEVFKTHGDETRQCSFGKYHDL